MNSIAFLDESGSLPDPTQPLIVVAALIVAETDVGLLRPVLSRIRKRLNQQRKRGKKITAEFKFETLLGRGEFQSIARVLAAIQRLPCKLVIVQVEKSRQAIKDDPANYAILISETVRLCYEHDLRIQFVFDRHYLASQFDRMQTVNHTLAQLVGAPLDILHKDSQERAYPGLGLVDFVAGASRLCATTNPEQAAHLVIQPSLDALTDRIMCQKAVQWTNLKAGSVEKLRVKK